MIIVSSDRLIPVKASQVIDRLLRVNKALDAFEENNKNL